MSSMLVSDIDHLRVVGIVEVRKHRAIMSLSGLKTDTLRKHSYFGSVGN